MATTLSHEHIKANIIHANRTRAAATTFFSSKSVILCRAPRVYPRRCGGLVTKTADLNPEIVKPFCTSRHLYRACPSQSNFSTLSARFEKHSRRLIVTQLRTVFLPSAILIFLRVQEESGCILCWADVLLRDIYQNYDIAHRVARLHLELHISGIPVMSY